MTLGNMFCSLLCGGFRRRTATSVRFNGPNMGRTGVFVALRLSGGGLCHHPFQLAALLVGLVGNSILENHSDYEQTLRQIFRVASEEWQDIEYEDIKAPWPDCKELDRTRCGL